MFSLIVGLFAAFILVESVFPQIEYLQKDLSEVIEDIKDFFIECYINIETYFLNLKIKKAYSSGQLEEYKTTSNSDLDYELCKYEEELRKQLSEDEVEEIRDYLQPYCPRIVINFIINRIQDMLKGKDE